MKFRCKSELWQLVRLSQQLLSHSIGYCRGTSAEVLEVLGLFRFWQTFISKYSLTLFLESVKRIHSIYILQWVGLFFAWDCWGFYGNSKGRHLAGRGHLPAVKPSPLAPDAHTAVPVGSPHSQQSTSSVSVLSLGLGIGFRMGWFMLQWLSLPLAVAVHRAVVHCPAMGVPAIRGAPRYFPSLQLLPSCGALKGPWSQPGALGFSGAVADLSEVTASLPGAGSVLLSSGSPRAGPRRTQGVHRPWELGLSRTWGRVLPQAGSEKTLAAALIFEIEKLAIRSRQLESLSKGYPTARFPVQGQDLYCTVCCEKKKFGENCATNTDDVQICQGGEMT